MKKPRPHKAKKSRRSQKADSALPVVAVVAVPAAPARTRDDAWQWHAAPAAGPSGKAAPHKGPHARRAKGPPPPKPPRRQPPKPAIVAARSKLSPQLEARLAEPLPTAVPPQPIWHAAQRRAAESWRADRVAAVLLFLPTLLTAVLLVSLPRVKAPLERTTLIASLKTPRIIAEAPPPVAPPQPDAPPFVRPPERLAVVQTWAMHDLDAVAPALARDIAELAPPFARPPEALAPSIVLAEHDLVTVTAALAHDVAAARPAFTRPAEALVAAVPEIPVPETPAPVPTVVVVAPDAADANSCRAVSGSLDIRSSKRLASVPASPVMPLSPDMALADDPLRFGLALSAAAKAQANDLVVYNARYMQIAYPRGDVPALFGVCTDVVIRAYRALDIDLQELVHQSRAGPADTNIDHRRTELLRKFFATHGEQLAVSPYSEEYLPGDIVTYYRPQNKSSTAHIAVVTDVMAPSGRPMIAHNRGWGVQLEDALFVDQMTGHYRFRGLNATAVAALPRNVVLAAAKRPLQRVAEAPRTAADRQPATPAAASTDGDLPPAFRPPMALGLSGAGQSPASLARGEIKRCQPTLKDGTATCRPVAARATVAP